MFISTVEICDYNDIKSISDTCFGVNYISINQLNKTVLNDCFYYKITINNKIIGFCLSQCYTANSNNLKFDISETENQKIAVIKSLAIHPKYQRKGYGTKLLKYIIHKIEIHNKTCAIYYPSWRESTCNGFCNLVKAENFKEVDVYKNYWSNESFQNNYTCKNCGAPPCNCTMILYRKMN